MGSELDDQGKLVESARAVERERRRIARGLHDLVGPKLDAALRELERTEATPQTERAQKLIRESLAATRSLTFELGLPPVGEFGLGGLLETVCRTADAGHEVDVFFEEHGDAPELSDGVVLVLSQIVRELLHNVVKHANATSAAVTLDYEESRIRITVTDDGAGLAGPVNGDGFGLADSRIRVQNLGGRFEFGSKDGIGTRVVLELPVG
jgi:signal transduction histidine kinase